MIAMVFYYHDSPSGSGGSSSIEEITARLREAGVDPDAFSQRLTKARGDATKAVEAAASSETPDTSKVPQLLDAAMRGYFLPSDLGFSSTAETSSNSPLHNLLTLCEVVPVQGQNLWQLKPGVRRNVLLQANASNLLTTSAAEREPDSADPTGTMLRRVLTGFSPEQDKLPRAELEQLATVSTWLEGTGLAQVPPVEGVRREIAKRELLDPFRVLIGRKLEDGNDTTKDRIVGRARQIENLRAYVGIVPPELLKDYVARAARSLWQTVTFSDAANEPLVIEGIGGMGKSSLIAKFILDHALPGVDLPFAYLDFDRAALAPRAPLQLLIDISLQFGLWFPAIEPKLAKLRDDMRNSIDRLASVPTERIREDTTRSSLNACCFELKKIVESMNQGRAPVLLVFDTFEVVQYDDVAVKGVVDLISVLRAPKPESPGEKAESWKSLRIVVAGRGGAPEIATSHTPIKLGPLPLSATAELIRRRNDADALALTKPQIAALAKPLRNSPLDVTIVMNWLKSREPAERATLVDTILAEIEAEEAGEEIPTNESLAGRRITGILINRMIHHINDPQVKKLANPGLIVRAVTPEVIRNVMAPASGLVEIAEDLSSQAAEELFRRLQRERWLVTRGPSGTVRHRPEVRLAMLDLMRRQDLARFNNTNRQAVEYFRQRAQTSDEDCAETIYHLLLQGTANASNIEEAERFWRPSVAPYLASAVDDLYDLPQIYLKAKLGRSVPVQALRMLPTSAVFSVLLSFGKRFLQRGLSSGLSTVIDDLLKTEANPKLLGLYWESLYRSGQWANLRKSAEWEIRYGMVSRVVAALREGNLESMRVLDEQAGWPVRYALRLATRDPQMTERILRTGILSSQFEVGRTSKVNEAFWEFAAFAEQMSRTRPDVEIGSSTRQLVAAVADLSGSERTIPAAAATSGALRVLAFCEAGRPRKILRRLDFDSYFSTVSGRELQEFSDTLAAVSAEVQGEREYREERRISEFKQLGENLLRKLPQFPIDSVIADPTLTREFASAVRALVETDSERGAIGALRILALTNPDWLEPLGHALTRAFRGKVPSKLGWWSSVESYFGSGGRRRGRQLSDGHEILSLADEATCLPEAVDAYFGLLDQAQPDARDFIEIVNAFRNWRSSLAVMAQAG
jgi:hypothetical protein